MNLLEKSLQVRTLFDELKPEVDRFSSQSKLSCIKGCGHCCTNPMVSASVLEFLPLAFELYHSDKAEETLEKLSSSLGESYCILLKKMAVDADAGLCTDYKNRGLICRLFASSARRNKHGEKELLVCKKIKDGKREEFENASKAIKEGLDVPLSSDYYTRLYNIDFNLTNEQLPINRAIQNAIHAVMNYYYYSDEGNAV